MHSIRLALLFIFSGIAIPFVCLPVLHGYLPKASLLTNIQVMTLKITSDKMEPDFREVNSIDSFDPTHAVNAVSYANEAILYFPNTMSDDDMGKAIRAEPRFEQKKPLPKFMGFYGWAVPENGHGIAIPFKYITFFGLLLTIAGLLFLTIYWTRPKNDAEIG